MRRSSAIVAVMMLLAAACGDSGSTTTTTTSAVTTTESPATTVPAATSTEAPATSTTAAPTTTEAPATSTTAAPTTTAPAPTTTAAPAAAAAFAIKRVVFGDAGYVEVTNFGGEAGDIGGHWICQRPSYFEIPPQVLEPGQSVLIATGPAGSVGPATAAAVFGADGGLGQFSPNTGEVALYASSSFSDPQAIRSYVEWGREGGVARAGRGQVAARAGIWVEGQFVVVPDGAVGLTATMPPTDEPADWIADEGG